MRNDDERLPAFTNKALREKPDSWGWGWSTSAKGKLEIFINALQHLVKKELTAAAVIANFHRQRVIPLMERRLPILPPRPRPRARECRASCSPLTPLLRG